MGQELRSKSHFLQRILLIVVIFICCLGTWRVRSVSDLVFARTLTTSFDRSSNVNCQSPVEPNSQSLLVVLLDRSGSLIQGNVPTDPHGYSTSVTKALADLWPGNMAVIPFSGDTTQLPILGPDTLSNPVQRADLKQKVQDYPIGGDTPLEPAMQEAFDLLHQQGSPPGSRVIVITDGNPTGIGTNDGSHQEDAIRKNLIPQYCQQGIPVSAFGLTIDPNTPDGQDANRLLTDIANGTGTSYTNVTGPEDLAKQVIRLYAEWQGLTFTQVSGQGSNFPVSIDPFAQQVSFVSFRSDSHYQITLIGPDNQAITTGVQKSLPADAHYEIDTLVISGPIQPGPYTVNTGGDPNAQVYVLVNSPLQVQLVAPTVKTIAYADKPVQIQAQFLNGTDVVTPTASDGAQIVAKVTLLVNGRPAGPPTNDIVLTQQSNSPIFSGQTLVYKQPGELQIELDGTYKNVPRQTSFTLELLQPLPVPTPTPTSKPPQPCCQPPGFPVLAVLIGIVLLFTIIALILWWMRNSRPKPRGWICSEIDDMKKVDLRTFTKPLIRSGEIQMRGNFNFGTAKFEIQFEKDGRILITKASENSASILVGPLEAQVELDSKPVTLNFGDYITPENGETVSYESVPKEASFW